jgi:hypothetical protein
MPAEAGSARLYRGSGNGPAKEGGPPGHAKRERDPAEFLRRLNERIGELDLDFLARDVEPFLFSPEQQGRVATFRDYWLNQLTG